VDDDGATLAGRLDDVVAALRRLTLDPAELSLTAAATLTTLRRQGPARLTELAAIEGVSQPSMTALVGRLAGRGLVERSGDPSDRRVVVIGLTPAGAELLDRRRAARTARLTGSLGALRDDDVRRITDALPALSRLASAHSHPAPSPTHSPTGSGGTS
jgi:DNA-binding MarR family transcriptional regulator